MALPRVISAAAAWSCCSRFSSLRFQIFPQIRISLGRLVRELSSSIGALHRVLRIFRPLF